MSPLHSSAVAVLREWRAPNFEQDSMRYAMLAFLDAAPTACLRECEPGHITASALVVDSTGSQVLLTLHPRVGRWIQLGGHCEPTDTSVLGAALREATEESGIPDLTIDPNPLGLHTHPITCSLGKPTRHLDMRFLVRAPEGARIIRSAESTDLRWFPLDQLPGATSGTDVADPSVDQLVRFALGRGDLTAPSVTESGNLMRFRRIDAPADRRKRRR